MLLTSFVVRGMDRLALEIVIVQRGNDHARELASNNRREDQEIECRKENVINTAGRAHT